MIENDDIKSINLTCINQEKWELHCKQVIEENCIMKAQNIHN